MNLSLPRTYIFSVEQNHDLNLDKKNTLNVLQFLTKHGVSHKLVEGSYHSVLETSIAVFDPVLEPGKFLALIRDLALDYNQKTILEISENDRKACLIYVKDGGFKNVGTFKPVSKITAEGSHSYTYDPTLKQHYVAE